MKFINYSENCGKFNMDFDEKLLNESILHQNKEPIFRLYGWKPACISLGRNQKDDFVDKNLLKKYNIDIVRRLTGGRALLHDKELTYSFVGPFNCLQNGESVKESYKEISQILIDIFKELNIKLNLGGTKHINTKFDYCMLISTGADLCWNDRKFIGSAQCRKSGYILQHGSILFDYDKKLLEELFKEKVSTNSIVSLKEINADLTLNYIIETTKNIIKKY